MLDTRGKGFVARHHAPPSPSAPRFLLGKKLVVPMSAEHAGLARPRLAFPPRGPKALGVVFDEVDAVGSRAHVHQGVHVGALAKQMHHHHRLGLAVMAARTEAGSIWKVSGWMSTNTGVAPTSATTSAGGDEREVGDDHFVTRPDVEGAQGEQQRVGAVAAAHDMAVRM